MKIISILNFRYYICALYHLALSLRVKKMKNFKLRVQSLKHWTNLYKCANILEIDLNRWYFYYQLILQIRNPRECMGFNETEVSAENMDIMNFIYDMISIIKNAIEFIMNFVNA